MSSDSKRVLSRFGYEPAKCRLLGKGGFGRVYRYCGTDGDRALKVIKYDRDTSDEENRRAITREVEIGEMMSGVRVGPYVFAAKFDDANRTAIVEMERMDMDLIEFFEKNPSMTQETVDGLSHMLSEKLGTMAFYGFKCLDLKPENIMVDLDRDGNVTKLRIIDFDPRFCSELESIDQADAAATAMKLLLAANTHRVHPDGALLFESELSGIDDDSIDSMLSDGKNDIFFHVAWHYLMMEKPNRRKCVKNILRDLVHAAKGRGGGAGHNKRHRR